MKITNLLLSLTLAGFCFQQASAQVSHPQAPAPSAARHIGDGVRSIGDTNRYVPGSDDVRPAEFLPDEESSMVSPAGAFNMGMLAPTASSSRMRSRSACNSRSGWLTAESLLWFSEQQNAPALVTTADQGTLPVAGANGVTTAFGGPDGIDRGIIPGFRLEAGMFIDSDEKIAAVGRVYGIFQNEASYSASSTGGTPSLGLPFYNLQSQQPDAFLVGYRTGGGILASEGTVNARSDLQMLGAEGSLHLLLSRSSKHRADMLVGYTYNRLNNSIGVVSQSTDFAPANGIPDVTVFDINDLFETENTFHGAHLGVLSSVTASQISLTTLAKVSFGSMSQTAATRGFTTETFNGSASTSAGGILTQASNIGSQSRNQFAFIPELGIKLGYQVNDNVNLSVGYTFMFWSTVALAGDQIDTTVDLTQAAARPAPMFEDSTFWMQGIDLGLSIDY
jgi:hypothetical protein